MSCLLTAQVFLQCNDDFASYHYVCKCVGFIQHYFWLASFSCMNAMAFKLQWTFSGNQANNPNQIVSGENGLMQYALYALIAPLVITGPFFIMDLLDTGNYNIDNIFLYYI